MAQNQRKIGLLNSLTANLDRLKMLEGNLFNAGYPEQASSVQWAITLLDTAHAELKSATFNTHEGNKKPGELP